MPFINNYQIIVNDEINLRVISFFIHELSFYIDI